MSWLLRGIGLLTAASLVLPFLVWVVLRLLRRRPQRFWRRVLVAHAVLVPLYALVVVPGFFGWFASRHLGTRPDERGYEGPWLTRDGRWLPQQPFSLPADGKPDVDPAVAAAGRACAVRFESADGVPLRGFLVPPPHGPSTLSAVLVHGLFRGALEIDPVGAMLHDLGVEVLLLELRNHGGSGRAPATFGFKESEDVVAAVQFLHARTGHQRDGIVLFGVSLGTAAVILSAPRVEHLSGLVLDAPIDRLRDAARRFLSEPARPGTQRRRLQLVPPFDFLVIQAASLWSGFRVDQVQPILSLPLLPDTLPSLVIGGSLDERVPPDKVREAYEALRAQPGVKELWIREGSGHGEVWRDDPEGYRAHLSALIERARRRPS